MRFTIAVIIAVLVNIGGTAYGQQQPPHGCTSIPNQGICPSPTPTSPAPTPSASATPTPVPTVEATVGVQETRPPWESPEPPALPGDEVRGEVVRRTDSSSKQVPDGGAEELAYTGVADLGVLLLIFLGIFGMGLALRWWSEKRGYFG